MSDKSIHIDHITILIPQMKLKSCELLERIEIEGTTIELKLIRWVWKLTHSGTVPISIIKVNLSPISNNCSMMIVPLRAWHNWNIERQKVIRAPITTFIISCMEKKDVLKVCVKPELDIWVGIPPLSDSGIHFNTKNGGIGTYIPSECCIRFLSGIWRNFKHTMVRIHIG